MASFSIASLTVVVVAVVLATGARAQCAGKQTVATSSTMQVLSDGSGGGNYLDQQECVWRLTSPPGTRIELTFTSFATECAWDHLYVYDEHGIAFDSALAGVFSGSALPPPFVSSGPAAAVVFVSDMFVNAAGFVLSYRHVNATTVLAPTPCLCANGGRCTYPGGPCSCPVGWIGPLCADAAPSSPPADAPPWILAAADPYWAAVPQPSPFVLARTQAVAASLNDTTAIVYGGTLLSGRTQLGDVVLVTAVVPSAGGESASVATTLVAVSGDVPPPRGGACGAYDAATASLWVAGGEVAESEYSGDVYVLRLTGPATGVWSKAPGGIHAVTGCAAAALDGTLYVYGGFSLTDGHTTSLTALNMSSGTITPLAFDVSLPFPMQRHAASLVAVPGGAAGALALFGGSAPARVDLGDLWLYDVATGRWTQMVPPSSAAVPMPRYMHTALLMAPDVMAVIGGRITTPTSSGTLPPQCFGSDVWVYSFSRNRWAPVGDADFRVPAAAAAWPTARYAHAAVVLGDSVLLLSGFAEGVVAPDAWMWPHFGSSSAALSVSSSGASVCDARVGCSFCLAHPACGWCGATGACVALVDEPLCSGGVADSCSAPTECSDHMSCTECTTAECGWCGSSCVDAAACSASITDPAVCPPRCRSHGTCGACMDDTGCSWCNRGGPGLGFCYPPSTEPNACTVSFPKPEGDCSPRCELLSGCNSCLGSGCMYCDTTDDCFASADYLMAYPFGECADWHFGGQSSCPVPCSAYSTCSACTDQVDCGWCSETGTCMEGALDGDALGSCSAPNWEFYGCPCEEGVGLDTCDPCLATAGCVFCVDSATCLDAPLINGSRVAPPGCALVDTETCPDCSVHSECGNCTADPACGWCGASETCFHAGPVAPPVCAAGWLFDAPCPSCTNATSCSECTAKDGCGWCEGVGCTAGSSAYGPFNETLECAAFDVTSCVGHCLARGTSCTDCVGSGDPDECGWCCTTKTCAPPQACPAPSPPTASAVYHTHSCPACGGATACDECSSPCCGWCESSETCSLAAATAPDPSADACPAPSWYPTSCPIDCDSYKSCSLCIGLGAGECGWCVSSQTCYTASPASLPAECELWSFGPTCPVDCRVVESCSGCVGHPHCTWCESLQECAYEFDLGTCPNSDWHSATCPVDCSALDTCAVCVDNAACGWCTTTNSCMRGNAAGSLGAIASNSCPAPPPTPPTDDGSGDDDDPTVGDLAPWLFSSCDSLCATRLAFATLIDACNMCTADRACGYCPLLVDSNGVGSCRTGTANGLAVGACSSYVHGSCPALSALVPGTARAGALTPSASRLLVVFATSGEQTLGLDLEASAGRVVMYVSTSHYQPASGASEWQVAAPGRLSISPADFPAARAIPVGAYYISVLCVSSDVGQCAYRLLTSLAGPKSPPQSSAFWIVYFIGVFFGALFGIILISVLVKKLRESLDAQPNAFPRHFVPNRVRPFVPFRVLIPGDESVASPWFLILPVGSDAPSVHAVVCSPGGHYSIGEVVRTAPGKKMVRASNRSAIAAHDSDDDLRPLVDAAPDSPRSSPIPSVHTSNGSRGSTDFMAIIPPSVSTRAPLPPAPTSDRADRAAANASASDDAEWSSNVDRSDAGDNAFLSSSSSASSSSLIPARLAPSHGVDVVVLGDPRTRPNNE